ncbi:MAG: primase-helicase family protein [Bacteroidota bacterium]
MSSPSFYEQRMAALKVTDDNNYIQVENPDADYPMPKVYRQQIFQEDNKSNIVINYYGVDGKRINYDKKSNSKTGQDKIVAYQTKRLKEPKGDMKYQMPKGVGTKPWFAPATVEAFRAGETIETLYLTEGVFKSWYASLFGFHVVGLASVTCYRDREGKMYRDVIRLIERCKVENVVILWDADCRDVSLKDLARQEELTRRPRTFFSSIQSIRKLVRYAEWEKTREAPRVYFMHPRRGQLEDDPKGLDDVLMAAEQQDKIEVVVDDLKDPNRKGSFFARMEISTTVRRLGLYFGLDKKKPQDFYDMHAELIGENQFYFNGDLYVYVEGSNSLECVAPSWAKDVIWVGDDFFLRCEVPTAQEGLNRYKLMARKKDTLNFHYGKEFQNFISYYTSFCNKPSHTDYKAVIELNGQLFYNRYFPFEHVPEEGGCPKTIEFIKHIFGEMPVKHPVTGKLIPRYQLGLDYVQLLYQNPTQMLPVLILFSPENNTGKSTFGKLLAQIFRNNIIFVSNSDFQSDFNSVFVDKLAVICDETLLERKKDTERIKAWSTATEMTVNEKNVSQYTIDFFTKFIFNSNNPRMIYLSSQDERFWIIQVPKAKKENPHLLKEMIEEIPAFIEYLNQRKLATEHESRMYFHPMLIRTDNFYRTVEINEPGEVSNMRQAIQDMFDRGGEDRTQILMPMKNIRDEFFPKSATYKWIAELLREYLGVEQLKDDSGKLVFMRGSYIRTEQMRLEDKYQDVEVEVEWRGRPYVFPRELFIDDSSVAVKF